MSAVSVIAKNIGKGEIKEMRLNDHNAEVPYIEISSNTPSRYHIYAAPPALLTDGLGMQQFGPQFFRNDQPAAP